MVEIIAEAAQGYLGDNLNKCLVLSEMAAASGADAIKFQLVYAEELCTTDYKHYDIFSGLLMEDSEWVQISDQCNKLGISLYLDIFGQRSLALAEKLHVKGIKLHSTDLLNAPLMELVAKSSIDRVILGTGGTVASEIKRAIEILQNKSLVLMHGFQGYPTQHSDNHVSRVNWLKKTFPEHEIGFGDHVQENDDAKLWLSSVALGAGVKVLEKHLTRAQVLKDEDHEAAISPDEFSIFVKNMKIAFSAYGIENDSEDFGMSESELNYRKNMKKHVTVNRDMPAGTILGIEDLHLIRTMEEGDIHFDVASVLGRELVVSKLAGQALSKGDIHG